MTIKSCNDFHQYPKPTQAALVAAENFIRVHESELTWVVTNMPQTRAL
jgi:hypothetical protein